MWLALRQNEKSSLKEERTTAKRAAPLLFEQDFEQRLLAISPDLYFLPIEQASGLYFLKLSSLYRYWNLPDLLEISRTKPLWDLEADGAQEHPFLAALGALSSSSFCVLAPSAALAYTLLKVLEQRGQHKKSCLYVFSLQESAQFLKGASIKNIEHLGADLFVSKEGRKQWELFLDFAESLGWQSLEELSSPLFSEPSMKTAFIERAGKKVFQALSRSWGQGSEMQLEALGEDRGLHLSYSPFERSLGVEASSEEHDFEQVFQLWQRQLELRKMQLASFWIRAFVQREQRVFQKKVTLLKPSLDIPFLLKQALKAWSLLAVDMAKELGRNQEQGILPYEEIQTIEFSSQDFRSDEGLQLSLFDGKKQLQEEALLTFFSELCVRYPQAKVGLCVPQPSYFPESALRWESLFLGNSLDSHSAALEWEFKGRPWIFERKPKPLKGIQTEKDFWKHFLASGDAPLSLERFRNPWSRAERSYVRLGDEWQFWEHREKRAYLHAYFESEGTCFLRQ